MMISIKVEEFSRGFSFLDRTLKSFERSTSKLLLLIAYSFTTYRTNNFLNI